MISSHHNKTRSRTRKGGAVPTDIVSVNEDEIRDYIREVGIALMLAAPPR